MYLQCITVAVTECVEPKVEVVKGGREARYGGRAVIVLTTTLVGVYGHAQITVSLGHVPVSAPFRSGVDPHGTFRPRVVGFISGSFVLFVLSVPIFISFLSDQRGLVEVVEVYVLLSLKIFLLLQHPRFAGQFDFPEVRQGSVLMPLRRSLDGLDRVGGVLERVQMSLEHTRLIDAVEELLNELDDVGPVWQNVTVHEPLWAIVNSLNELPSVRDLSEEETLLPEV